MEITEGVLCGIGRPCWCFVPGAVPTVLNGVRVQKRRPVEVVVVQITGQCIVSNRHIRIPPVQCRHFSTSRVGHVHRPEQLCGRGVISVLVKAAHRVQFVVQVGKIRQTVKLPTEVVQPHTGSGGHAINNLESIHRVRHVFKPKRRNVAVIWACEVRNALLVQNGQVRDSRGQVQHLHNTAIWQRYARNSGIVEIYVLKCNTSGQVNSLGKRRAVPNVNGLEQCIVAQI